MVQYYTPYLNQLGYYTHFFPVMNMLNNHYTFVLHDVVSSRQLCYWVPAGNIIEPPLGMTQPILACFTLNLYLHIYDTPDGRVIFSICVFLSPCCTRFVIPLIPPSFIVFIDSFVGTCALWALISAEGWGLPQDAWQREVPMALGPMDSSTRRAVEGGSVLIVNGRQCNEDVKASCGWRARPGSRRW